MKKAHQIQEIGEFQEFNDDVDYILDALQDNNPISTRCLSAITLASKCMVPAFRMHVRAHGTVAKFFKALHDATKDQVWNALYNFRFIQLILSILFYFIFLELRFVYSHCDVCFKSRQTQHGFRPRLFRINVEFVRIRRQLSASVRCLWIKLGAIGEE